VRYDDRRADAYDHRYRERFAEAEAAADFLAGVARPPGPVLELGVGTGRIAVPLTDRGLEVHGIDASPAMVAQLRAKPGGDAIPVQAGDFADVGAEVTGGFGVVFVAFNTLFNLPSAEAQARCFTNVARRLGPGGRFVVEAFVPDPDRFPEGGSVSPTIIEPDHVVLLVARQDRARQTLTASHVSITEEGIRLRPLFLRYSTPAELDAMALAAGLELEERWSGWDRRPYDDEAERHVSVYRRSEPVTAQSLAPQVNSTA
jgi:SAM-dependent methyltransferase